MKYNNLESISVKDNNGLKKNPESLKSHKSLPSTTVHSVPSISTNLALQEEAISHVPHLR